MHCQLIKANSCKVFSSEFLFISAALIFFIQLLFADVKASNFHLVLSLSNECFNSRDRKICLNAIEKIEEFQLISGSQEDYSCQTRLLGLESKLIMVILNKNKNRPHLSTLNQAKTFCDQSHWFKFKIKWPSDSL